MPYIAEIDIMPLKELLDPQGKAVKMGLTNLGIAGTIDVRVGKHITLTLNADTEIAAKDMIETACKKLLANPVMEYFHYTIKPA